MMLFVINIKQDETLLLSDFMVVLDIFKGLLNSFSHWTKNPTNTCKHLAFVLSMRYLTPQ